MIPCSFLLGSTINQEKWEGLRSPTNCEVDGLTPEIPAEAQSSEVLMFVVIDVVSPGSADERTSLVHLVTRKSAAVG
jgi:hypothetical protein